MAVREDYYQLLGVERTASDEEIKRAFRRLARQYHPDANPDDPAAEERFKEINEAYEILSDADKRARYDRYGHAGVNGPGAGGPGGPGFGGFEDIFDAFFGGFGRDIRSRTSGPQRGPDLEIAIEIELDDAARGLDREVDINRIESCHICGGNGVRPGSRPERCPQCQGTGQVRVAQSTIFGRVMTSMPCDACGGGGVLITDPCPECDGRGLVRRRRKVAVKVPAGIPNQTRLRLVGQGQGGLRGGPAGDLYVEVRIKPHRLFERRGNDIVSEKPVSYIQAVLGGTIDVDTLWGGEQIVLPAGTQPGEVFALSGLGMPDVRGRGRGDHHVVVRVQIPKRLTARERELLAELARESGVVGDAAGPASGARQKGTGGGTGSAGGKAPRPTKARRKGGRRGFIERVKDALAGDPDESGA